MTTIFISHSSADRIAAKDMKRWLEAQGHTSMFLDFDVDSGIKAGTDWEQTLYQKLRQCQAVIALLSPDWIASKWCFAEGVLARKDGKAILPVKVAPCDARGIFDDIQQIDLTTGPEEGYRRLAAGLLARGLNPRDVFDWDPTRPPYPGFMAFEEEDAAIFFGRGLDIVQTLEALEALRRQGREAPAFALLIGASGSGKSSLARAGVIPRLRKQPGQWLPVPPFRPQLEPLDELAMSLAAAFQAQKQPRDWRSIHTELEQAAQQPVEGQVLVNLARDLAIAAGQPEATVLLTIDQTEELFGYTAAEPTTRFLQLLRAALEMADRRLMAIATLRSDFLGHFQNHPTLQDSDYPHHFRYRAIPVDPMLRGSFAEIIQGPARLAGLQLDDGLVQTMVDDTGTRDALPLLAFTLHRLHERFGGDGRLTVAEYEELGRLDGAVREEAQQIIDEVNPTPEEDEALHAAFVPALVRINAEGSYVRRRAVLNTLPPAAVPLLLRFVNRRLLVTDWDTDDQETIEVAHEALLRTWPQLVSWLTEDHDKLRLLESLRHAAEEWELGGRGDELLAHRGTRLKDVEALAETPRFSLTDGLTVRQYLNACREAQTAREAAEKQEQDRRREIAQARQQADARFRDATSLRLVSEVQPMLSGIGPGGAVRAYQQLLAARRLAQTPDDGPLVNALVKIVNLIKIADAGSPVSSVAFSPDGTRIATSDNDGTVRLWDPATGQPIGAPLTGHTNRVTSVAFSPDGKRIASASYDATVRLWDAAAGQPVGVPLTGNTSLVFSVAFSPDGTRIASGGGDKTVRLWDAATGQPIGAPLTGHTRLVGIVAFSPDGKRIASGSADKTVRLWDAATGQPVGDPLQGHTDAVTGVAFSPDGRRIATGGDDKTVRLWDADTGQPVGDPLQGHTDAVTGVAFSPDGRRIVSGSADRTLRVWDADSGQPIGTALTGHTDTVTGVAFSPDGRRIVSGSADRTLRVWDADSGQPIGTALTGHTDTVLSVVFSPDGTRLATGGWDSTVRLWDADSGQPIGTALTGHTGAVNGVAFSPDGTRLATSDNDGTVRLWDAATGHPVGDPLQGHTGPVWSVAFSPDGTRLATSDNNTVRLWDPATGHPIGDPLQGHTGAVWSVAFSPDGTRLATGSDNNTVRLWDPATGHPIGDPLQGHTGAVRSVAFSPDGTRLATGSADMTVRLWDPATGHPIGDPLQGHTGAVNGVAFSPDGTRLATGSADMTVRLWDPATGHPAGALQNHTGGVNDVAFSPDGTRIATGDNGSTVRLWPTYPDPASTMCGKLTTNMSHQQWRDWVSPHIDYTKICPDLPVAPDY